MREKCIFCDIAEGKIPAKKIYENGNFFSIPDAHPVAEGHSLIISKKHYKTVLDIMNSLGSELLDCIKNTSIELMKNTSAEGFNLVNNNYSAAGQIVNHVHFHIIPRWKNDGLKLF